MHQGSLSRVVRLSVTGVSLVATCACSVPREILELEVSTWWAPGSEETAFQEVRRLHEQAYPSVRIESTVFPRSENAREFVARNVLAGAAPDTFQANIGADLIGWTMVDTADPALVPSTSHIDEVGGLLDARRFWNRLPSELVEALRVGDLEPPFAIPINIHRLNLVYYRRELLEDYEREHGEDSFLDLSLLCPTDGETPIGPPRLALGGGDKFPQILLLFENLVPAIGGPEFYESFLRGASTIEEAGPQFRRALSCLQHMASGTPEEDRDFDTYGWKEALNRVHSGVADYTVMGDWANGYIQEQNFGDEIASMPFPGTEKIFVFTSDTFPLPVSARHPEAAKDLLRTIASEPAQKAFSEIKGSIPALLDVELDGPLAEKARATRAAFDSAPFKVMATSGYFPQYLQTEGLSSDILGVTTNGGQAAIDAVMERVHDYGAIFSTFQQRIQRGPSPRVQ
jgi:glucose/mannose transport system substrate-binding protein